MLFRNAAAAFSVAAFVAVGAIAAAPALAAATAFQSWSETGDPKPMETTGALTFFKGASINFGRVNGATLDPLVALADVEGLAYTVADSTSYAPSYQVGVVNTVTKVSYARLVWEPYMQSPSAGDNKGTYVDLEKGLWWGANVWQNGTKSQPFGSGDGSQSKPQPLAFFASHFGPDTQVQFFGLKQGTTTDSTSTITSLTFGGTDVPLGTADQTPFGTKDVDAAVAKATAPLATQIDDLKAELAAYKASHPLTPDAARDGYVNTLDAAKAKWNLVEANLQVATQNDLAAGQAKIVSISGTKRVGHTVTAKTQAVQGASRSYQWYVAGRAVKGATKATLKLARSSAHHSLAVKVTTTWTDTAAVPHSVVVTVKYLRTAYIAA